MSRVFHWFSTRQVWMASLGTLLLFAGCYGEISKPPTQQPNPTQPATRQQPPQPRTVQQEVYFADMKPFLGEFCVNCHGAGGQLADLTVYHDAKRGKEAVAFWAWGLQRVQAGSMPPTPPKEAAEKERFAQGLALYVRWGELGYPEKPGSTTQPPDPPKDNFPTPATCQGKDPLTSRIWRLTGKQITYSLIDIFGEEIRIPPISLNEQRKDGFSNNATALTLNDIHITSLVEAFDAVAKEVITKIPVFQQCVQAQGTDCIKTLVTNYGQLIWRRPLTTEEIDRLVQLAQGLEQDTSSRNTAIEFVIERLLISPNFLYRSEIGLPVQGQADTNRLDGYEAASFLSYLLWQSAPDTALLDAAKAGQLSQTATLKTQLERMLKDPRARRGLQNFVDDWLLLEGVLTREKDTQKFPELTPIMRQTLKKETELFLDSIIWQKDGKLVDLFTSNETFMSRETAPFYGQTSVQPSLTAAQSNPQERAGILTQPAYLIAHSGRNGTGFVHRGVFFLEQLVCRPLPAAPANAAAVGEEKRKGVDLSKLTEREIQKLHASDPGCASCHKLIDPPGAAFEIFDPLGRYRGVEKGMNIDAAGELQGFGDMPPQFKDAVDLIRNLAPTKHFQQCFTQKLFTFALGSKPEDPQNCMLAQLYASMQQQNFTLRQSYAAFLSVDALFLRKRESL
ncbi:MAG: DUF1592 domain-containing protein [Myxococcales bacterium]|nr:DUF1592 domain-containing protein [Myxococcales bacterium]MCB9642048.1 DUF1592 domain-containing protein [Myxococcales bacterium]